MNHLRRIWAELRGSLWFIPLLTLLIATILAPVMVAVDRSVGEKLSLSLPLVFEAGPDGAREVLGTIAGSVLALAGVAFSFTILAFSLASSQYSPRILHNFMDDRTNQIVLGVLMGSFLYCLLVLRTVRAAGNSIVVDTFVPSLSVTVALLLALLDLALFILYLHHISVSVTGYHIINRVGQSAVESVSRIFPEEEKSAQEALSISSPLRSEAAHEVRATSSGYVQEIDIEKIVKLMQEHKMQADVSVRTGEFVTKGKLLAIVIAQSQPTEDICEDVASAFLLGLRRTPENDALFGVMQLSAIAVKAMSPGINDPTTALMCLDQIERVLSAVGGRQTPQQTHCDEQGTPRVAVPVVDFRALVEEAFGGVRHYGVDAGGDVTVAMRMLVVMANVAEQLSDEERRTVLGRHAHAVVEAADRSLGAPIDRALLDEKIAALSAKPCTSDWKLPLLGTEHD